MGLNAAVIDHLRSVANQGRQEAPPGLGEHFARQYAMAAYIEMREVRSDLGRLGLLVEDNAVSEIETAQPLGQLATKCFVDFGAK